MDTRQGKKDQYLTVIGGKSSTTDNALYQKQLTDSLIFNLLKKIELRTKVTNEYYQSKEKVNTNFLTKYLIHSKIPAYYFFAISMYYLLPFFGKGFQMVRLTKLTFFMHVSIIISINELYKYKSIKNVNPQLWQQYQQHKKAYNILLKTKIKNYDIQQLLKPFYFSQDNLLQLIKWKLL